MLVHIDSKLFGPTHQSMDRNPCEQDMCLLSCRRNLRCSRWWAKYFKREILLSDAICIEVFFPVVRIPASAIPSHALYFFWSSSVNHCGMDCASFHCESNGQRAAEAYPNHLHESENDRIFFHGDRPGRRHADLQRGVGSLGGRYHPGCRRS